MGQAELSNGVLISSGPHSPLGIGSLGPSRRNSAGKRASRAEQRGDLTRVSSSELPVTDRKHLPQTTANNKGDEQMKAMAAMYSGSA